MPKLVHNRALIITSRHEDVGMHLQRGIRACIWMSGVLALSACHRQGSAGAVIIGQASPLTGQQAAIGKDNENGVRLAIEDVNARHVQIGGRPLILSLDSQDDQADPRIATEVAQKFVDEGAVAVIGHLNSGTTIPASRIYAEAHLPQISPSATAVRYTHQGFATAFRLMANDAQQGQVLGRYVVQGLHARRIAVIDDRTAYGQGLADEFVKAAQAAGASISEREYTDDKANDFSAILTHIAAQHPDVVFFGGMYGQAAPMVQQMHRLGLNVPLLGGDGVRTPEFIHLAGADATGTLASKPGLPLAAMPQGAAFKARFEQRFGPIQNYAPYAYDAVGVLVAAMQRAQSTDPRRVLPALAATRHYAGVTGDLGFDAHGDLRNGPVTLYKVVAGHWQVVQTVNEVAP